MLYLLRKYSIIQHALRPFVLSGYLHTPGLPEQLRGRTSIVRLILKSVFGNTTN